MSKITQQKYDQFLERIVAKLSSIGFFEKTGRNPKNVSCLEYQRLLQSDGNLSPKEKLGSVLVQYTADVNESRLSYRHETLGSVTLGDEEFYFAKRFYHCNLLWGFEELSLDEKTLASLPKVVLSAFVEMITKGQAFLFEDCCYSHPVDSRDACIGNNIWDKPEELNEILMQNEASVQYRKDRVTVKIGEICVEAESTPKAVAIALIKHKIALDKLIVPKRFALCNATFYLEGNTVKYR